jgi:hypothetical protein
MATVAIIHAADDALPARALAEKLRQAKLTVVLEKPPGEQQRNAAQGAKVTIALWSPRAVAQPAIAEDVAFARSKSKVVHACMQNAAIPESFRGDKSVNLTGWRGEDTFPAWRELAKLVTDRAGVSPLPPPAPRPASGFFQPGVVNPDAMAAAEKRAAQQRRSQPQRAQQQRQAPRPAQRAPQQAQRSAPSRAQSGGGGGGRTMMIAVATFVAVALVGGGGYYFWSQSQGAQSTSAAWDGVDTSSADALRAFISGDPGEYRDDAESALASLEERSFEAASDADTIEALEAFLNDFPESEHALSVRGRIAELQTLTPTPEEEALPEEAEATDPDLVPPGTTPDASGGPAPLTPPAENPPSEEGPTN